MICIYNIYIIFIYNIYFTICIIYIYNRYIYIQHIYTIYVYTYTYTLLSGVFGAGSLFGVGRLFPAIPNHGSLDDLAVWYQDAASVFFQNPWHMYIKFSN